MQFFNGVYDVISGLSLPTLLLVGIITFIGLYAGKSMKWVRMPSIIGFMLVGVIIGPSFFNTLDETLQTQLSFITEIALGFVALSIGLELNFKSLRELGTGIIIIIICESFFAFIAVTAGLYLLTGDLPLSLHGTSEQVFGTDSPRRLSHRHHIHSERPSDAMEVAAMKDFLHGVVVGFSLLFLLAIGFRALGCELPNFESLAKHHAPSE